MGEIVRRSTGEVDPAEAARLSKSKLVPEHIANDAASAEYMMQIGAALGIAPVSAFQHIYVFPDGKGRLKAGLSAHLMGALALAAGHNLHVEGDQLRATATLIRKTDAEELQRFRVMREEERQRKSGLLEDMNTLYGFERQQILDRITDMRAMTDLGGNVPETEIADLLKRLSELHGQYDFEELRRALTDVRFDLARILRFESIWTMRRANSIEGLTTKSTWQNYGPEMLKSRAKSSVVRDGAIDVILGIQNFMANLGVEFSGDRDDEIAMGNALYTPEELGAEVDESGAPIKGEVIDVTEERTNRRYAALMKAARTIVEKSSGEALVKWAESTARRADTSIEDKISRLEAVREAAAEAGKAEETVPGGDSPETTLSTHLGTIIDSLR